MENGFREFERLVAPNKRRGRRRRELLKFVAENPGATPYQIAKKLYGNPLAYHKTIVNMLRMFERRVPGLFEEKTEGRARYISLSEKGKDFCKRVGIVPLSAEAESVVKFISSRMPEDKPLTFEESGRLYRALSPEVCETALEVYRLTHRSQKAEVGHQILAGIWSYEIEAALKREREAKFKPYLEAIVKQFKPAIDRGLISRRDVERTSEKILLEAEKKYEALRVVESAGLAEKFDGLLSLLNSVVLRSPSLEALKEEVMRGHEWWVAGRILGASVTHLLGFENKKGGENHEVHP